ncbi:Ig-like domain-containing protein [Myxococcus sp. CA056]|uniref:Ig-like domain-containing protein n=1 Tax=Myxococcus sp. CA056 TaxID=2741740 RepID=UPI001C2D91D7
MVAVLLSAPACIDVPGITPVQGEVRIRTPEATAYTRGVLDLGMEVTGHRPDRVELLRDGEVLAVLESPYTYSWDTAGEAEGEHRLGGRVVFGETVFTGEERVVVVDRTAPQVVSRAPEPGAQDVWVKSPIQAVFSEPVNASTVTSASVRLTVGGVEVARTVSLSGDGKTMTVVPATPISGPTSAAMVLTLAVTDRAGNALEVPVGTWDWRHSTMMLLPYGPVLAKDSGNLGVHLYEFGSDKQGNSVIVQSEKLPAYSRLRVYSNTGSQWMELGSGLEARTSGFEPYNPTVRFDPLDGTPVVAWHEGNGSNESERIYVARWMGTHWSYLGGTSGILPSISDSTHPVMDLDATGKPLIAYYSDTEQTTYAYRWTGTAWEPLGGSLNALLGLDSSYPIGIKVGPTQSMFLAMRGQKNGQSKLYVVRWNGTDWKPLQEAQPPVGVPFELSQFREPRLSLAPDDKPILAWVDQPVEGPAQAHSYIWKNDAWEVYCPQHTPPTEPTSEMTRLELDDTGTVWMAWSAKGTPFFHIERCTSGSWTPFASSETTLPPISTATFSEFTITGINTIQVVTTLADGGTLVVHSHLNR